MFPFQPTIVLSASGVYLTGWYYMLPALKHSLCALRGCFHAALLDFCKLLSRPGWLNVKGMGLAPTSNMTCEKKTIQDTWTKAFLRSPQNSDVGVGNTIDVCVLVSTHPAAYSPKYQTAYLLFYTPCYLAVFFHCVCVCFFYIGIFYCATFNKAQNHLVLRLKYYSHQQKEDKWQVSAAQPVNSRT